MIEIVTRVSVLTALFVAVVLPTRLPLFADTLASEGSTAVEELPTFGFTAGGFAAAALHCLDFARWALAFVTAG